MLDPWIIKEILRREEERRQESERARVEIPLERPIEPPQIPKEPERRDRGVEIIDI